jgi:hypothetical protein
MYGPNARYLYMMQNPINKNMIKIGITNDPHRRLKDLNSTGMPAPLVITHLWYVSDAYTAEQLVHSYFDWRRYSFNREYFEIYPGEHPADDYDYEFELDFIARGENGIEHVMNFYEIEYQRMNNHEYQSRHDEGKQLFPNGPQGF